MSARRGLQLPQTLRDEIEAKEKDERLGRGGRGGGGGKRAQSLSRKDARKASRTEKKERKAGFFSQPRGKRANDDTAHPDAPPAKKAKLSDGKPAQARPAQAKPQPASATAQPKPVPALKPKEAAPTSKSTKATGKTKLEALVAATASKKRRARDEEDDKIAYLEAKLGLDKKRKKKTGAGYSSAFADDGLDDLLGDLDRIDDQLELRDDDSAAELDAGEDASSEDDEDGDASDSDVAMDEEDEWQGIRDDDAGDDSTSSQSDDGDDVDDDEEAPQLIPVDEPSASPKPAAVSEVAGRYVPPALRKQQLAESAPSEEALKLQRQLKGLLNRMSEQNIASVLADFEEAYRKHRRHDVTSTLTTLILDGIASHGAHLDSFVVLHAALVGALHRLVGIEFAAHFVQAAVARYDAAYAAPENDDERGKECANVLALLAALYALQVVACVLPYDLVRGLLAGAGAPAERDVELLLKLVRAAGPQMRADDPAALRDIVQLVQDKTEAEGAVGSRTKFMIETLVNLKNGKAKHGPDADGSAGAREVVERMKKFLSGLAKKRTVMAHEPLRVGLADLREADKRGRWWLVGAAWAGDPLVEHQTSGTSAPTKAEANTEQDALLALARKHGMNTDVRRSIFVVLLSSEDCVDAAARVAALGLNAVQQREVPRVALHCLGAERAYNPFWALVVQKTTSPAQKITLQFALWDFLRGMGEARVGGAEVVKGADAHADAFGGDAGAGKVGATKLENVARAYGWWIAKGACAITALKPLEFELLKPQTRRFVTRLLVHLFISTQVTSPAAPIAKATRKREEVERVMLFAARVPTLQQGLLYFLNSAFKKPVEGPEAQLVQWAVGVAKETLAAGVDIGALEEEWD